MCYIFSSWSAVHLHVWYVIFYVCIIRANYPNVRIHNCSNDFTHMRYCTTLKQTFASYWISHFVIRIRVDSINRIGASTSSIEFHPTNHGKLACRYYYSITTVFLAILSLKIIKVITYWTSFTEAYKIHITSITVSYVNFHQRSCSFSAQIENQEHYKCQ